MITKKITILSCVFLFLLGFHAISIGQISIVIKSAQELTEFLLKQAGKEMSEELVEFGGKKTVQEILEQAYKEGGEALVDKVVLYGRKYGVTALKGIRQSPKIFVKALDDLPKGMIDDALAAVRRDPELMVKLTTDYGSDALKIAAKHPGVGPQVVSKLGREGIEIASDLSTNQVIQLNKIATPLSKLPAKQKNEVLKLIEEGGDVILGLLERHPKVLYTSATAATFLTTVVLIKDQVLGETEVVVDDNGRVHLLQKTGLLERVSEFRNSIASIFVILALILGGWGAIKLFAVHKREKIKTEHFEMSMEKKKEQQISSASPDNKKNTSIES